MKGTVKLNSVAEEEKSRLVPLAPDDDAPLATEAFGAAITAARPRLPLSTDLSRSARNPALFQDGAAGAHALLPFPPTRARAEEERSEVKGGQNSARPGHAGTIFSSVQNNPDPEWEGKVTEYFREKLKENNATSWVPSLNDVPLHYLKPNSLVKFRCMIQDMFDPEFYMNIYETVDTHTKSRVTHFGKYRDIAECGPHQEIDLNPTKVVTAERQTFYCVPVPGESAWVKEISF
ncbi:UNVERIFIED_CONTAM: hypothetical protein K2H54_041991 [Gekko kuhli]